MGRSILDIEIARICDLLGCQNEQVTRYDNERGATREVEASQFGAVIVRITGVRPESYVCLVFHPEDEADALRMRSVLDAKYPNADPPGGLLPSVACEPSLGDGSSSSS